ncbi:MAG: hypothetical protein AAF598_12370 [Bacteroidota bacterium]
MKPISKIIALSILTLISACKQEEAPITVLSDEAALLQLDIEYNGQLYPTEVNGLTLSLETPLPFEAETVILRTLEISAKASVDKNVGATLIISESPISIEVTAENQQTKRNYLLNLEVAPAPSYADLLFDQFSASSCAVYATIDLGDLKVENNVWNTANLPANSFTQCIFTYESDTEPLLGWQWAYPDNANGVNAYPQVIYGWKPWQPPSTTALLPKKLADINRLKVTFEAIVERNNGDYNLAFDNWINSSPEITPENILFEFMIWEDTHQLVPFGDFQEEVVTSNGTYRFYSGEPDWEPPGSNWTYLAFQRIGNRTQGTVDIDELLVYLIDKGIVSPEHYLASVEFGNEIGNSTGQLVLKQFDIELE